jgi:hypothetical protein
MIDPLPEAAFLEVVLHQGVLQFFHHSNPQFLI